MESVNIKDLTAIFAAHRNAARNTYRAYEINATLIELLFVVQSVCDNSGRTEIPFSLVAQNYTKTSQASKNRVNKRLAILAEKSFIKIKQIGTKGKLKTISITPLGQFAMKLHTDTVNNYLKRV